MTHTTKASLRYDLRQIADLLEICGESKAKSQAIRKAALTIARSTLELSNILEAPEQLEGIGTSIAKWCRDIVAHGAKTAAELHHLSVPIHVTELLLVTGVGIQTAKRLYDQTGIDSLEALENALIQHLPLLKVPVTTQQRWLKSIHFLKQTEALLPIAEASPLAQELCLTLSKIANVTEVLITGDLRRGVILVPRIHLLVGTKQSYGHHVCEHIQTWLVDMKCPYVIPFDDIIQVEWNLGRLQLPILIEWMDDWRLPIRLFETTGDDIHWTLLQKLAEQGGTTFKELARDTIVAVSTHTARLSSTEGETEIYETLGLPWYPAELREDRGVLCQPNLLIREAEIRGDLHTHTKWSDGSQSISDIVNIAVSRGYEYVAITDHSPSLHIANGLSAERLFAQGADIAEMTKAMTNLTILHGMEVDILSDGRLDMEDEILFQLDIVVASIHQGMQQSPKQITKRLLAAIQHPAVDIIGHPTGRIIGRRPGYSFDIEAVITAAAEHGVALELNANPNRLDLDAELIRQAVAAGVRIVINTDAHHPHEFKNLMYGIQMARRGWLKPEQVLNTMPLAQLKTHLHQFRNGSGR